MERDYSPVVIKNAHIFKTNFAGKEIPPYNPAGRRNFLVSIPDINVAEKMAQDGWNVRFPKDPESGKDPFISVAVNFSNRPPKIIVESSKGKTKIDEESIDMLDWAEMTQVDLSINPRYWDDNGVTKIKAYLRTMRIVIFEDELEKEIGFDDAPTTEEEDLPFD